MTRSIMLLGLDSLREDHCSCYGYDRKTTLICDGRDKRAYHKEASGNPAVYEGESKI